MSKEIGIMVFGTLLIIQTQFGVPDSWHTALVVLSGCAIIVLGFLLRTESLVRSDKTSRHQPFVENYVAPTNPKLSHDHKEGIGSLN